MNGSKLGRTFFGVLLLSSQCLIWPGALQGYKLGMLGEDPDWNSLDVYQETMSREEFVAALETLYLPYGYNDKFVSVQTGYARIKMNEDEGDQYYHFRFAPSVQVEEQQATSVVKVAEQNGKSLDGLIIAIDPGHIGGDFSELEERHFKIGDDPPIKEGDLTLIVSRKLSIALEALGATVRLIRKDAQPLTERRAKDFIEEASIIEKRLYLDGDGRFLTVTPWDSDWFKKRIQLRAEMLFYRVSEIQARAKLINEEVKPDLTIAVHFNVAPWLEETQQVLAEENHMHVIVHGTYTPGELGLDDVRFHLFRKLLSRNHEIEIPLSSAVANSLAKVNGLPAFRYGGKNASNQGNNPYLWARNLLANRLFVGPVVFLEAYCANSRVVYQRIQLGDYNGLREVDGRNVQSLYAEYVEGVVEGIVDYYHEGS
ncbi:MAG: N-acetylmuramoyl-L-alanine amidase [Verrucomicrobia bacterium]|nr:N-acetylmuramoyl-L-alanine amidase [Verrucomicrobiota bacterium]